MICKDRPFLAEIEKTDTFSGSTYDHTVQHGFNQSAGPTVAVAEETRSTNEDERFTVPRRRYYGSGKIEREVILATRDNVGSVVRKYKQAQDSMIMGLGHYLDYSVWGNGGGAYGKLAKVGVASGLLATQVQLENPDGSFWLERNMKLQFSVNDGYGAVLTVRQPGGGAEASTSTGITLTIDNVDTETGIVTFTGAVPVAAGEVTVGDFIFRTKSKGLAIDGVTGWCPRDKTRAALAYLGATRANNVNRLSGQRWLTQEGTMAATIRRACAYGRRAGAQYKKLYMNPMTIDYIEETERSKVVTEAVGELEIGFEVIKFRTQAGMLDLVAEPGVPPGWAFATDPADWEFKYLGGKSQKGLVSFFEEAGLLVQVPGEDAYSFRGGGYGNLVTHVPGNSLWIKVDPNAKEI